MGASQALPDPSASSACRVPTAVSQVLPDPSGSSA
jgi:hypothetical protein